MDFTSERSFGRTGLKAHSFKCGSEPLRHAASNGDLVHCRLHLPSARQLLSQHSPARGEWSSPGELIHPDEHNGGTGRVGRHQGWTAIRVGPSGPTGSRFTSSCARALGVTPGRVFGQTRVALVW